MNSSKNNYQVITNQFQIVIVFLLIINISSLINNNEFRNFGLKSIDATLVLFLLLLIITITFQFTKIKDHINLFYLFGIYILIYYFSYFFYQEHPSIEQIIKLTMYFLTIISLILIKWNKKALIILAIGLSFFSFIIFRQWIIQDFPTLRFRSYFKNQNTLAILLFISMFFTSFTFFQTKKYFYKILFFASTFCSALLIYTTTARAVFLAIVTFFIALLVFKYKKSWFKYLFHLIILFNFLFILFYSFMNNLKFIKPINQLSLKYLNKPFLSGRENIWSSIINDGVMKSPFLGYGFGTNPSDISEVTLTTHNVYLQILLEVGIIGLVIFILILLYIWKLLLNNISTTAGQFSSFFFLATLVYITFEMTLFPNSPTFTTIGLFQWLGITIGINYNEGKEIQK